VNERERGREGERERERENVKIYILNIMWKIVNIYILIIRAQHVENLDNSHRF